MEIHVEGKQAQKQSNPRIGKGHRIGHGVPGNKRKTEGCRAGPEAGVPGAKQCAVIQQSCIG